MYVCIRLCIYRVCLSVCVCLSYLHTSLPLFRTTHHEPLMYDRFRSLQRERLEEVGQALHEDWPRRSALNIRRALSSRRNKDDGPSTFDILETQMDR